MSLRTAYVGNVTGDASGINHLKITLDVKKMFPQPGLQQDQSAVTL